MHVVTRLKVLVHTAKGAAANNDVVAMARITVASYHVCDVSGLGIFQEQGWFITAVVEGKMHNRIAHVMVCPRQVTARETVPRTCPISQIAQSANECVEQAVAATVCGHGDKLDGWRVWIINTSDLLRFINIDALINKFCYTRIAIFL